MDDELLEGQANLQKLLTEFESVQRKILMCQKMKDAQDEKIKISMSQDGLKGKIGTALNNLTMYTLESNEDSNQIKFKLQQTQDYLYEIEKKITKQRARIDELNRQKAGISDKIAKNEDMNAKLDAVLDARTNNDLGARAQVLAKQLA